MKKFYSILLILFILPSIFIFSSCKFEKKYSLKDFYAKYLSISEESNLLTKAPMPARFKTKNTEIVSFVYSAELSNKISTITAYSYITDMYNTLLDDVMGPTYLHVNNLSGAKISNKDKEYLLKQLNALRSNYKEIALRLGDLERNQNSSIANDSLSKLYYSYENAILTAINISTKISNIFYNKIMEVPNKNYIDIPEKDVNLEEVAITTLDLLTYYKLVFADIYLETKIIGYDVPTKIVNGTFNAVYEPYNQLKDAIYSNMVKPNIEDSRKEIVKHARTLYIIQLSFENEYKLYHIACNKIVYGQTDEYSSKEDMGHKQIIDSFVRENGIAYQAYLTVKQILDLCY